MAIYTKGQRRFPAVVIVCLLFLFCLYPGQVWVLHLFPSLSGPASIAIRLVIVDTPVQIPGTANLLVVLLLFLVLYLLVLSIFCFKWSESAGREIGQRFGAVLAGFLITLTFLCVGGLLTYVMQDANVPRDIRNGLESLGIDANLSLAFTSYKTVHLHGNVLALLCLVIGVALSLRRIGRAPTFRKVSRLTPEQRMSPYDRMLQERRHAGLPAKPARLAGRARVEGRAKLAKAEKSAESAKLAEPAKQIRSARYTRCVTQPLYRLEPEAVNYRPML